MYFISCKQELQMSRKKSPPEKKADSYKKDRRNTYGENSKSSRKNIPLAKAREHREARRVPTNNRMQVNHPTSS
jgi:hypothetical protein